MTFDPAQPTEPTAYIDTKVYEAVCEYVRKYALPVMEWENIIMGWGNLQTLPPGTQEYAVVSILHATQIGTTVERFEALDPDPDVDGVLSAIAEYNLSVQIDFCSATDDARKRALRIASATRSSIGSLFFGQYGMGALYAEDPRDVSFISSAQYVRRWVVTIHVDITDGVSADYPYFERVAVERLENVDVHHPVED